MTIAQLEQLLREHLPEIAGHAAQQGRAGVTKARVSKRYDDQLYESPLRKAGAEKWWWKYEPARHCPVCDKSFARHSTRRKYCSDACQQKAYRARKKAKRI